MRQTYSQNATAAIISTDTHCTQLAKILQYIPTIIRAQPSNKCELLQKENAILSHQYENILTALQNTTNSLKSAQCKLVVQHSKYQQMLNENTAARITINTLNQKMSIAHTQINALQLKISEQNQHISDLEYNLQMQGQYNVQCMSDKEAVILSTMERMHELNSKLDQQNSQLEQYKLLVHKDKASMFASNTIDYALPTQPSLQANSLSEQLFDNYTFDNNLCANKAENELSKFSIAVGKEPYMSECNQIKSIDASILRICEIQAKSMETMLVNK